MRKTSASSKNYGRRLHNFFKRGIKGLAGIVDNFKFRYKFRYDRSFIQNWQRTYMMHIERKLN